MRPLRRLFSLLLCLALLLSCSALASAEDLPYLLPVQLGGGSFQVRAYSDGYGNNIYLSLADLSTALSGTEKQFALGFASTPTDGDMFLLTSGQPSAGPSTAGVNDRRRVSSLYLFRNRLFLDNRELKYYTCRLGTDLYMSLTDIQLMLDLSAARPDGDTLVLDPGRPFAPDPETLEREGYFDAISAVVLGDADTGEILFYRDGRRPLPVASLSKLMSYLLLCEAAERGELSFSDNVTITEESESISRSADGMISMSAGSSVPMQELVDAMLLASSNEAAASLAACAAGSSEAFVERMNERAKELGLSSARFFSPHGLPVYTRSAVTAKRQNLMSAYDMFRLCGYLLENCPQITGITGRQYSTMSTLKYSTANTNTLVFNLSGISGLKTGSTDRAGCCVAVSMPVTRGGETHDLVLVLLGAETAELRGQAAEILLRWARNYYVDHEFRGAK